MKTRIFIYLALILFGAQAGAQVSSKTTRNFGTPFISDSSSTLLIPTVYDASLFTSNKLALWGNFYSNIIFYNFLSDSSKKLFPNDTYILSLDKVDYSFYSEKKPEKSIAANWIFYKVMNVDRNKNDKIDSEDPSILYVSDRQGNGLKALTAADENVLDFHIYQFQNFALVKIQRDANADGSFTSKDTDFYYIKLNLNSLSFGNKIELH